MEEGFNRRLFLPDVRGNDSYLRVTWHKETSTVVLSHWHSDVCVASTRVCLEDATKLIGLVVGALKEAAARPGEASAPVSLREVLLDRLRGHLRPQLAQVVKIHDRLRHDRPTRDTGGT